MIPKASREILKTWQAKGLKFKVGNTLAHCTLGFNDLYDGNYNIPAQPIPEGCDVENMWRQGLMLEFRESSGAWVNVMNDFQWALGIFEGDELIARLRIPAQPIPKKLLQEPVKDNLDALTELLATSKELIAIFESDPNGLDPHAPGAKLDAGKNRLGLVLGGFAQALEQVGLVGTGGAVTYSDNGWKEVDDGIARYEDAMLRHWVEIKKGNAQDLKTGLLHQAHLVWNALAVLELMLKETK